jgi:hypothetical protein
VCERESGGEVLWLHTLPAIHVRPQGRFLIE